MLHWQILREKQFFKKTVNIAAIFKKFYIYIDIWIHYYSIKVKSRFMAVVSQKPFMYILFEIC
jgi:hypothetical protein